MLQTRTDVGNEVVTGSSSSSLSGGDDSSSSSARAALRPRVRMQGYMLNAETYIVQYTSPFSASSAPFEAGQVRVAAHSHLEKKSHQYQVKNF